MRQFLLATALVLGAVAVFFGGRVLLAPDATRPLGDLTAMQAIVSDVNAIVGSGDLVKAKARIADLETAWDDAEPTLRPKDPEAWGRVDDGIDAALSALRKENPLAAEASAALDKLQQVMADPAAAAAGSGPVAVEGIAVTDASGHPLPCEEMIQAVKDKQTGGTGAGDPAAIDDLIAKATERCNADDDRNADAFSARALKALGQG